MTCVVPYTSVDCANVTTWNPRKPTTCKADSSADVQGVCGIDGRCYTSGTTIAKVIQQYKNLRDKFFNDPTIAQFQAFNKYEEHRVCAMMRHALATQPVQPWRHCCLCQGSHHLHGHSAATAFAGLRRAGKRDAQAVCWYDAHTDWSQKHARRSNRHGRGLVAAALGLSHQRKHLNGNGD